MTIAYHPTYMELTYGNSVPKEAATKPLSDIRLTPPADTDVGDLTPITRSIGYDWFMLVFRGDYYTYYYDTSAGWSYEPNSAVGISRKDLDVEVLKRIDNAYELPTFDENRDEGRVVGVSGGAYGLMDAPGGGDDFVIVFSGATNAGNAACDKTWEEICEAYYAGKTLKCYYRNSYAGRTGEDFQDDYELLTVTGTENTLTGQELRWINGAYTQYNGASLAAYVCFHNGITISCEYSSISLESLDGVLEPTGK